MKFLEAENADNVSIADLLHAALKTVEPARPIANLHASALTNKKGFCPREVVLCKKLARKPYPSKLDLPLVVTFHEGRDKQYRLNNYWLRNLMVGNWHCLSCQTKWEFTKAPKGACCAHANVIYDEVVYYHPSGAQGSLDALLDVGKMKLRLVEFKIMAQDEWVDLKMPLAEHKARSELYLELIEGSNHPHKGAIDTSRIHVLYCLRGYGKLDKVKERYSPFKEFIVHRNPQGAAEYLDMAQAVTVSKNSEWGLIPEGICDTMFDKRCHTCCVSKECFSGKFPATLKWK